MPYNFQKCTDREGVGNGAGCRLHPGCRAGIPGLTACAGGWGHRDPRGMILCMHENGGLFGEFCGVGGWGRTTAGHTIDNRERSDFQQCKICFSPPSSLSPILPLLGAGFSFLLLFSQYNID